MRKSCRPVTISGMEPNAPSDNKSQQADPYDFILKSGGKLSKVKNMSTTVKLAVLGGGIVLFLLVSSLLYSSFFKAPDNSIILSRIGRQQAQILQAADIGVKKARSQTARNLAITTEFSLIGDQKPLLKALSDQNVRVSTKKDPQIEQKFTTAEQANRFDETLLDYFHTELTSYAGNLKTAYNTTKSKALKKVLAAQYRNARFLSGQGAEQ